MLLEESIAALDIKLGDKVVDCTFGRGGHAREFLQAVGPDGLVIGLDVDLAAQSAASSLSDRPNFKFVRRNFRQLDTALAMIGIRQVDKVFFDFGVSSPQLNEGERGFSYRHDAPLDMRMDPKLTVSAADLVNTATQKELERILWEYGEERWSKRIASFVVEARKTKPVASTSELVDIIKAAIPKGVRDKENQHPARRTFQALRIAVNDEIRAIEEALHKATQALVPLGRVGCISFHSLEDRVVKQYFAEASRACICPPALPKCVCEHRPLLRVITRKAISPSTAEVEANPRSRSAHLRVAEKLPLF